MRNIKATPKTAIKKVEYPLFDLDNARRLFDNLDVSEVTRADYKARIKHFLDFVSFRGIYQNTLLEYKTELTNRITSTGALSISTKNKYLATARAYLKISARLFNLPDYSKDVKGFTQNKKHKKEGINRPEMDQLINIIKALPADTKGKRARALFTLLTFQGLRQIEIRRLRVTDIDLRNEIAFITGKGSDDRELIYLHKETVKALRDYIAAIGSPDGYLFQSLGNRKSAGMFSIMTLQREIKGLFELCNISKTVHGFRHFYITQLLEKFDVRTVRKFSRHSNLEMLIVYDDETDTRRKSGEIFQTLSEIVNF